MKHLIALGVGLLILASVITGISLLLLAFIKPLWGAPPVILIFAYLVGVEFTK